MVQQTNLAYSNVCMSFFIQWIIQDESQNNLNNEDIPKGVFFSDEVWSYLSGYLNSEYEVVVIGKWSFFVEEPLHPQEFDV